MAAQKRALEDTSTSHKSKKSKTVSSNTNYEGPSQSTSTLVSEEVDFPRGGGTSFTPLEVKTLRAEAVKEANQELFEVMFLLSAHYAVHLTLVFVGCSNRCSEEQKAQAQIRSSSRRDKWGEGRQSAH